MQHREWLCAIGISDDSERVLRFAHRASTEAGANLRIIHAIQAVDPKLPVQLDIEDRFNPRIGTRHMSESKHCRERSRSHASVRIAVGSVKPALIEAIRHSDADALIIGRSPDSGLQGRLRDLTYSLVRDSPVPVISV